MATKVRSHTFSISCAPKPPPPPQPHLPLVVSAGVGGRGRYWLVMLIRGSLVFRVSTFFISLYFQLMKVNNILKQCIIFVQSFFLLSFLSITVLKKYCENEQTPVRGIQSYFCIRNCYFLNKASLTALPHLFFVNSIINITILDFCILCMKQIW